MIIWLHSQWGGRSWNLIIIALQKIQQFKCSFPGPYLYWSCQEEGVELFQISWQLDTNKVGRRGAGGGTTAVYWCLPLAPQDFFSNKYLRNSTPFPKFCSMTATGVTFQHLEQIIWGTTWKVNTGPCQGGGAAVCQLLISPVVLHSSRYCCKFTSATVHKIKYTFPFVTSLFLTIWLLTIQWTPHLAIWIPQET